MGRWMENMMVLEAHTETEDVWYVESPIRSKIFLGVHFAWQVLEATGVANLLRRYGWIGPRMSDAEWVARFPRLWGVAFRTPKGTSRPMSEVRLQKVHRRNCFFMSHG